MTRKDLLRVGSNVIRFGGACGPPPPVAAALAGSLRAPSRGDPPLKNLLPRHKTGSVPFVSWWSNHG